MHSISIWWLSQELATKFCIFCTKRFVFYTYHFTEFHVLFVVAFRLSLFSLHVFLMIYLFPTTHIHSKRESYLKCLTVSPPSLSLSLSLSLFLSMMTVGLFFFVVLHSFFFLLFSTLIDINEMKMCVCVYICACGFSGWKRIKWLFYIWEIFHSFWKRAASKSKKEKKKKKEKTRNACVLLKWNEREKKKLIIRLDNNYYEYRWSIYLPFFVTLSLALVFLTYGLSW